MDTLKSYHVLDLEPGATAEQVRQAYVDLCQVWHPDRFIHNPPLLTHAQVKMREIEEAYHTLQTFLPNLHPLTIEAATKLAAERPEPLELINDEVSWTRILIVGLFVLAVLATLVAGFLLFHRERLIPFYS